MKGQSLALTSSNFFSANPMSPRSAHSPGSPVTFSFLVRAARWDQRSRSCEEGKRETATPRRVIAVSRFPSSQLRERLQSWGIETIGCDLLDPASLARLPDAPNVIYMAGMKFGATGNESLTWAMNSLLPGLVSERFRHSRIAAFSTGNIYGLTPVARGGSLETDAPNPAGEYAMSCLGRERVLEHFSRTANTKVSILRLNYATELRYGVLVDIAQRVYSGKPVHFDGVEASDALLSNAEKAFQIFGKPRVSYQQMMTWIADWIERGGETLA